MRQGRITARRIQYTTRDVRQTMERINYSADVKNLTAVDNILDIAPPALRTLIQNGELLYVTRLIALGIWIRVHNHI